MKTRITVKVDYELYLRFRKYVPQYHKSKVLESLIVTYLAEGLPERDYVKREYSYLCSFTIELSVWKQFKERTLSGYVFENMSTIIEHLIRNYMRDKL